MLKKLTEMSYFLGKGTEPYIRQQNLLRILQQCHKVRGLLAKAIRGGQFVQIRCSISKFNRRN
jgi:hypothetical protein